MGFSDLRFCTPKRPPKGRGSRTSTDLRVFPTFAGPFWPARPIHGWFIEYGGLDRPPWSRLAAVARQPSNCFRSAVTATGRHHTVAHYQQQADRHSSWLAARRQRLPLGRRPAIATGYCHAAVLDQRQTNATVTGHHQRSKARPAAKKGGRTFVRPPLCLRMS